MNQGYINVDALDEDMPTLRKLEALQLYRSNLKDFFFFFLTSPPSFDGIVIFGFSPDFSKYTFFCRNYIWRHLEGIGSTGLKEESCEKLFPNSDIMRRILSNFFSKSKSVK